MRKPDIIFQFQSTIRIKNIQSQNYIFILTLFNMDIIFRIHTLYIIDYVGPVIKNIKEEIWHHSHHENGFHIETSLTQELEKNKKLKKLADQIGLESTEYFFLPNACANSIDFLSVASLVKPYIKWCIKQKIRKPKKQLYFCLTWMIITISMFNVSI